MHKDNLRVLDSFVEFFFSENFHLLHPSYICFLSPQNSDTQEWSTVGRKPEDANQTDNEKSNDAYTVFTKKKNDETESNKDEGVTEKSEEVSVYVM